MDELKSLVTEVPNFPQPGISFKDISPLLASDGFEKSIAKIASEIQGIPIDYVAGIESRGFILGAALAREMRKGFIPVRKKGKLPPPTVSLSYTLEYGTGVLEMKPGSGKILLVDDVLATGGTMQAAADLCTLAGYTVQNIWVLIDLQYLNQFDWKGIKANSLVQYVQ